MMDNKIGIKTCLLLLLCLFGLVKVTQGLSIIKKDTIKQNDNLVIGKLLPDLSLQTVNGAAIKLSSLKGKAVLIDFWASWCMPCRASIPHLKQLYQKYHEQGFNILSVSIDQNSKAWQTAMLKEAMPWQQAIDKYEDGKDASVLMNALGFQSVPFAIVLDKDGKVLLINPDAKQIDTLLTKLFNH